MSRRLPSVLFAASVLAALLVAAPGAAAGPTAPPIAADDVVYSGIYPGPVFWDSAVIDEINAWSGKNLTFAGRFMEPFDDDITVISYLNEAWRAEATPFVSFQILDSASAIAGGRYDADIDRWASYVQRWLNGENMDNGAPPAAGRSLIIAPYIEMNGNWAPFGCSPANIKTAHRRMVDIFRARGIDETQVRWAFAPNGWTPPGCGSLADYYPGDAYTDILAFSAYNFGVDMAGRWETPAETFGPWIDELRATVSSTKPIVVAQTGSTSSGGDKNAWIDGMFAYLADDPQVVGFVYFNYDVDGDHACCPDDYPGWVTGSQRSTTKYQWPLTDWFLPGELVVGSGGGEPPPPPPPPPPPGDDDPCPDGATCDSVGVVSNLGEFTLFHDATASSSDEFVYGNPGDYPLMGDWDCDGERTPGQYRQSDGFVYLRNVNRTGIADLTFFFGDPGDVPLVGDFNGDGCDTVSIYRPSEGRFYIINALGEDGGGLGKAEFSYVFGDPGDKPFVGDFDGDGIDTIGLHRESTGFVYYRNRHSQGNAEAQFFFGDPGDRIVAGDWDGDGDDTVAVYRPVDGKLYLKMHNRQGNADVDFFVGYGFIQVVRAPRVG